MLKGIRKMLVVILMILIFLIIIFKVFDLYNIILKRFYPTDYSEYVYEFAKEYKVESNWIFAIIKAESNFNAKSVSSSGAIGLMQLMEATAKEVAEEIGIENMDLENPEDNIRIGTKYFANLLAYYNNNYRLAITAYNAGIGTVSKWIDDGIIKEDGSDIENIPYKETNNYIRKILNNYNIYKNLYSI